MKRRLYIMLCVLMGLLCISSCNKMEEEADAKETQSVQLYYLKNDDTGFEKVEYQIEEGQGMAESCTELLYMLTKGKFNETDLYKASIYESKLAQLVEVKGKEAVVNFSDSYHSLTNVQEILMRTSIVKTLIQLKGIDSVSFTINGNPFYATGNRTVSSQNGDDFLLDEDAMNLYSEQVTVKLYYVDLKEKDLVETSRDIVLSNNKSIETAVIEELMVTPEDESMTAPLSDTIKVNETMVANATCYVDFSKEFLESTAINDKLRVYAIVNSLTSLGNISKVKFTVEGARVAKLRDFEGFDKPILASYTISDQ